MALAKTYADYLAAVEYAAAIGGAVGSGSTYRHTTDDMNRELNSTYEAFREELTTRDFPFFIEESEQASLPTDRADANEGYSLIDWLTNWQVIKRIDTYVQGEWESLQQIAWSAIRNVCPANTQVRQFRPRFYALKNFGTTESFVGVDGTEYDQVAGKIALVPFATNGGVYKVSYLPKWAYIDADNDLFLFPDEQGFRWCVWEVVCRVAIRDRDAGKRLEMARAAQAQCELKIGRYVPLVANTGSVQMRRGRRYNG